MLGAIPADRSSPLPCLLRELPSHTRPQTSLSPVLPPWLWGLPVCLSDSPRTGVGGPHRCRRTDLHHNPAGGYSELRDRSGFEGQTREGSCTGKNGALNLGHWAPDLLFIATVIPLTCGFYFLWFL